MAIQKGTGFTNLNKILQANKGNKLGSTVSGGIQGQVSGVKSQVKSAQDQFQEEAQKNRLDTQESADKRDAMLNRFAPSTGTSTVQQQQTQPPTTVSGGVATPTPEIENAQNKPGSTQPAAFQAPTDQEIQDFTKLRTGTYTGPKELQDATSLYGRAQQAESLGGLARSEGGRQELLRRFVGGKDYTTGQRQLDSTLLGQKPGQLGQASREARGTTKSVEEANAQASNLAQEYTNKAKAFGEETTKKIGETKNPLSTTLDTKTTNAQKLEQTRLDQLKGLQDILSGTGDNFKGLDQWTRSGLALQQAADSGILSQADINMLVGGGDKVGLLQRGADLGLDMNALINERLTNAVAQNTGRTGIASDEEIAKLNALDRLAGKQGTDLEFLQGQGKYAAGKTGFNTGSLEDYISKTEAEKSRTDKAYADKLAAEQARYMNQAIAGGMQQVGAGMDLAGTGANLLTNPQSYYNPGEIVGNVGNAISAGGDMAAGSMNMMNQGSNAVMEGLLKLNIGGKSIANTPGGQQLLKALELKSKLGNLATSNLSNATGNLAQGFKDLSSTGSWDDALANLSGLTTLQDIGKQITAGDIGKTVGNIGSSIGNAVSNITGIKGVKISDEDLKENIDYSPKDIQSFMDRIKPAAYDYKDEVKDSPMASKNRELGVMAQDLEKSELGKEAVTNTESGKVVDYDNLEPKMLASIAALNKRLKELEDK